eukprot:TRINITY_DN3403_c0_g1_i1.p1 TRINITY_DN3403_c0_g1~~TRINITY_DN3403_c0_g1_i1.p1  ORF type:complete len:669 (+),score=238.06 TRINITY_DN3403_c0_g1_i1:45-2051(+)
MSDLTCINTIRCLCADVVQGANSGHPGAPLGMAPIAHVLFSKHMNFDSSNPNWINRDRFVLSNGHGCALLYSMLHLCGYDMPLEELKNFRQLGSRTPGHPERDPHHPGVEVTTGPLGQGIAQAVGIALCEKHLAARFNKPSVTLFDHYTYVFCGDGCLQEGVACEATSLAGHLGLGKLILVYDDNEITIDGPTSLSYSENVAAKFEALGWHTVTVAQGNTDLAGMNAALEECKAEKSKPSMILLKTTIGYGSKMAGTAKVHGAPLGDDDIKQLKAKAGLDPEAKYMVGADVKKVYTDAAARGKAQSALWETAFAAYAKQYPKEHSELKSFLENKLPEGWESKMPLSKEGESVATRKCSEIALGAAVPLITNMIGGSADLTGSNLTKTKGNDDISKDATIGRYIRFGIREHAMAAIGNGIAAYGAMIPFVATFFNFVTYAWGAVRVGALSGCGVIHVATHDSIGLGEDGPTHQPVEVAALCRATPNLLFFRPCDQTETSASYIIALEKRTTVSVIALSRQNVPMLSQTTVEGVRRGMYCVMGDPKKAKVIIVTSGTEVSLCLDAAKLIPDLEPAVISAPCTTLFDQQDLAYKMSILPIGTPVIGVEPFNGVGWERYCHYFIGLKGFGASAPAKDLYQHFGLTKENISSKARALAEKLGSAAPSLMPLEL